MVRQWFSPDTRFLPPLSTGSSRLGYNMAENMTKTVIPNSSLHYHYLPFFPSPFFSCSFCASLRSCFFILRTSLSVLCFHSPNQLRSFFTCPVLLISWEEWLGWYFSVHCSFSKGGSENRNRSLVTYKFVGSATLIVNTSHSERFSSSILSLALPMLWLLSSKEQGCKDFWKPSKPCHVGIHWIALTVNSRMSTHVPGVVIF